jgi:hypothetical protein
MRKYEAGEIAETDGGNIEPWNEHEGWTLISRSLDPSRPSPSSEELVLDEPTRSPLPRPPVRDTEVISDL